jgi:hypothetical protein
MTIHRPVFGRKTGGFGKRTNAPVSAPESVKAASAERILPVEFWDGPAGDSLREIGFHPDSPLNKKPTQADADARQDEEIALQQAFLTKVNGQLPDGCEVVPYAMLPWELWNGRFGRMLAVTCGLYATQTWNTMLLASDQRTGFVLDLAEHPGAYPDDLLPQLDGLFEELREGINAEMARVKASEATSWDDVTAWDTARAAMIPKIIAMSHYVGQMCIGEVAFARHKQLFGATLGWPGCER